jgi:hypothetical protein
MAKKNLLIPVVAYNLEFQFRHQASEIAKRPPRRLRFAEVLYTIGSSLLD